MMIIGSGLIANVFKENMNTDNVILFSSGSPDLNNSGRVEFEREENLILSVPKIMSVGMNPKTIFNFF